MSNLEEVCRIAGITPAEATRLGIDYTTSGKVLSIGGRAVSYYTNGRVMSIAGKFVDHYTSGKPMRVGRVHVDYSVGSAVPDTRSTRSLSEQGKSIFGL